MKQMKLIMAVVFTIALFTACTKEKKDSAVSKGITGVNDSTPSKTTANQPQLSYQITIIPTSVSSTIQWSAGYMSASAISLDGYLVNDAISKVSFGATVSKTIDLFAPSVIGYLNVPPGKYDNLTFGIKLSPETITNTSQPNAFYLTGAVAISNMKVPVQLMVQQPTNLSAAWANSALMDVGLAYTPQFVLNLNTLTAGIDNNMVNAATITDGTLIISGSSNANLYQVVVNNLQKAVSVTFGPVTTGINPAIRQNTSNATCAGCDFH